MSNLSTFSLTAGDLRLSPGELSLCAPAKLNLTLEVPGRLASGLHEITSVICPITLNDQLILRVEEDSRGVEFTCVLSEALQLANRAAGGGEERLQELSGPENLAFRAAELFLQASGLPQSLGLRISLKKNVPFEAGLGGGSSDAAAVLRGLSLLFPDKLSVDAVYALGRQLGSDIPALIEPGLKLIGGSGEYVEKLHAESTVSAKILKNYRIIVLKPPKGISTASAYAALNRPPLVESDGATSRTQDLLRLLGIESKPAPKGQPERQYELTLSAQDGISGGPVSEVKAENVLAAFHNDFEEIAFKQVPELKLGRELLLRAGARRVLLAGSGSALVGFWLNGDVQSEGGGSSQVEVGRFFPEQVPTGWFSAVGALMPLI